MSLLLSADLLKNIGSSKVLNDDAYDRLSRRYSVVVLGVMLIVVTSSQLVGKPLNIISCWCPAEFTPEMIKYTNSMCWSKSTYYVPEDRSLPRRDEQRPAHVSYYQWVPFILLLQIFLFYLPGFLWRNLNRFSIIDSKSIMIQIMKLDVIDDHRIEKVKHIVDHFDKALGQQRITGQRTGVNRIRGFSPWNQVARRISDTVQGDGHFLVSFYLICKLLYVLNAVGQAFMLNAFLGYEFSFEGIRHLRNFMSTSLLRPRVVASSLRFPLVTICDFSVRALGDQTRSYAVQCTLPINIFNDKVFLIVWYWLLFVSFSSIFGLICFLTTISSRRRLDFVDKHLNLDRRPGEQVDENDITFFAEEYCRPDGVFMLMLIEKNVDETIVGEIVHALWEQYQSEANKYFELGKINGSVKK